MYRAALWTDHEVDLAATAKQTLQRPRSRPCSDREADLAPTAKQTLHRPRSWPRTDQRSWPRTDQRRDLAPTVQGWV